jgi:hypothetical protein
MLKGSIDDAAFLFIPQKVPAIILTPPKPHVKLELSELAVI